MDQSINCYSFAALHCSFLSIVCNRVVHCRVFHNYLQTNICNIMLVEETSTDTKVCEHV